MKYIIDTHILLWYLFDAEQLPENAKQVIEGDNEICVSIASLWEIAIKQSIGKLNIDKSISQIEGQCKLDDIGILPISADDCESIKFLEKIHNDPFDRIIIAKAKNEGYTIITKDEKIKQYDVDTL